MITKKAVEYGRLNDRITDTSNVLWIAFPLILRIIRIHSVSILVFDGDPTHLPIIK